MRVPEPSAADRKRPLFATLEQKRGEWELGEFKYGSAAAHNATDAGGAPPASSRSFAAAGAE